MKTTQSTSTVISIMKDIFLNEKPVMTLVVIRRHRDEVYCSVVSKRIDTTYAHTVKIISKLEDKGLIKSKKKGRKKFLELTDKGEEYADLFIDLLDLIERRPDGKDEEGLNKLGGDSIINK